MTQKNNSEKEKPKDIQTCWKEDQSGLSAFAIIERERAWKHLDQLIFRIVAENQVLVDVGAGTCHIYRKIADSNSLSIQYIGIEPSEKMLEMTLLRKDEPAICVRAAAEAIPVADSSADIVMVLSTLDHCYDLSKALEEIHRIMKPDAKMLVTLTNEKSWFMAPLNLLGVSRSHEDHHYLLGTKDLIGILEQASFKIMEFSTAQFLPLSILPFKFNPYSGFQKTAFRILDLIDSAGAKLLPYGGRNITVICNKSA